MSSERVDLDTCAREPIHLSGAIQPHGVLLVLEPTTFVVLHASINVESFFGHPTDDVLGKPLELLLDAPSVLLVRHAALRLGVRRALQPLAVRTRNDDRTYDGILHLSAGCIVLELERDPNSDEAPISNFGQELRDSLAQLQDAVQVADLCRIGVTEIRRLTGFDRVMAYRFDQDDHGHVIAEAKRGDLESFLDLHYPASDIPPQARRLYTVNWLRGIVDVGYEPVPIQPAYRADGQPLDLSFSVLRSVSPIHVEYLRNMGVAASMSISLVCDGRLWGMFICHHYSPRFVPYELRVAGEFLARMLSWQIEARDRADSTERRAASEARLRELVSTLDLSARTLTGVIASLDPLLGLVDATGACVIHGGTHSCAGKTLNDTDLAELVAWLAPRVHQGPFSTHDLAREFPPAAAYADVASGVLAVPLAGDDHSFVLWFRPEVVQTVAWAGRPEKVETLSDGVQRLSPRGSFALWQETVKRQSLRWEPWQIAIAADFGRTIATIWGRRAAELERVNQRLQSTTEELRVANLAKDDFLATVSHELRNPLNSILGWVRILRNDPQQAELRVKAVDIIERNALQQAKLIEDLIDVSRIVSGKVRLELAAVDLVEIVALSIESVRPAATSKGLTVAFELDTQEAAVRGDPARLQQVVNNLLNNAVKFTPTGGTITTRVRTDGNFVMVQVQDTGKGIPAPLLERLFERFRQAEAGPGRAHQGLGLGLSIARHLLELHGGSVHATSDGADRGSTFTIRLPLEIAPTSNRAHAEPLACPPLVGATVLVVDDELDARELLATELGAVGARVLLAGSAEEALQILPDAEADLLISDLGMPSVDGYALLRAVRLLPAERGGRTPAIALTAYDRADDRTRAFRAGFDAHVPKPVDLSELYAVIANLLRDRAPRTA